MNKILNKNNPTHSVKSESHYIEENIALQEKITLLETVLMNMPGNLSWKDLHGTYLGCNQNVAQILGIDSPADIVGRSNFDLLPLELATSASAVDAEVISSSIEQTVEEIGFNIHKQPAIYLSKKIPLHDSHGNPIGLLGISFDISDRKQIENDLAIAKEKAETANKAKSQFLAILSHELRTPLTSILALITFLSKPDEPPEERKKIINDISNCTTHLLGLINHTLDFSKVESGKFITTKESFALIPFIQNIHTLLVPIAREKKLAFILNLDPLTPDHILSDELILRQLLINIISNAIKFTQTGTIHLETLVLAAQPNKVTYQFNIIDTGIGISAENIETIFEPFKQIEDAYAQPSHQAGTGLGLSIVKNLACAIGLKITVNSELHKGSTFSVTGEFEIAPPLPAQSEQIQKEFIDPSLKLYPDTLKKQPTILLVEDDPIVQFIHKKMLEELGCLVQLAVTGSEALQAQNPYDLALVDIGLPDINGFEVIRHLRLRYKTLPIIALTAYYGMEEKEVALGAGASTFVVKPIPEDELGTLLLKHL